ncbi:DUF6790 family protein [Tomitella gaofuii]|uniref:DUF6790 family protein n=1 Tax=Tomitella gaofuii TaxID=2760083 RepID=UPI001F462DB6|nr:DUF6790 family protein [Tomitella gaofuii]
MTHTRPTRFTSTPAAPAPAPAPDEAPPLLLRLLGMTTFIGVAGFLIAEIVQLAASGTSGFADHSLLNALTWLAGVNSLVVGCGHLMFPDPVAESIGWGKGSPFQWEVGLAGVSMGVLGILAGSGFDRQFQLAAVIAFAVFYLGAAVGHVKEMVVERNFAPGNAGFIFWYDLAAPVLVIVLYAVT